MRLLIVEDDAMILRGLVKGIDWKRYGFAEVSSAPDGEIGLELLRNNPFDVIITDINMPFMDGLELAEIISKEFPSVVTIILTGYQRFEYAKKALHLGVFEYLMKPVSEKQLDECMARVQSRIMKQREERVQIELGREKQRNVFFDKLFFSGMNSDEYEVSVNTLALPDFRSHPCYSAIACFTDYGNISLSVSDFEAAAERCAEKAELLFGPECYIWRRNGDKLNILTACDSFPEMLEMFVRYTESECSLSVSVSAVSSPSENVLESYKNGQGLLDCIRRRSGKIIWYPERCRKNTDDDDISTLSDAMLRFIYEGKGRDAESVIQYISDSFPDGAVLYTVLYKLSEAYHYLNQKHLTSRSVDFASLFQQFAVKDKRSKVQILSEIAGQLSDSFSSSDKSADSMNSRMLEYIDKHYADSQLSLTQLGDYMDMSPVYLCSLFKKRNGISFTEYVTDMRMTEACRLLRETEMKVFEISQAVGLPNNQYFTTRFKKLFGMTPLEYRDNNQRP